MGRSAPGASTALEKRMEVTATGADVEKSQEEHWGPADERDEGRPKKTGGSNIWTGFQLPHANHWHPSTSWLSLQCFENRDKTRFEQVKAMLYI